MSEPEEISLFPLHAVLFPGGALALRIFEPRYLDMISECMKQERPFGIALIQEGAEIGKAATPYEVGTLSEITYFQQLPDGVLGITATGVQRFRIEEHEVLPSELIIARVQFIPNEPEAAIPAQFQPLVDLLRQIVEQLDYPYAKMEKRYDDAAWVGARLTELLPLKLAQKQYLLQMNDPIQRLERLAALLEDLNIC